MKVDIARVRRATPGRLDVHLVVTTHGRAPEVVQLDIAEPRKLDIGDGPLAFYRSKSGELRSPMRQVDGKWVRVIDEDDVALVPLTDDEVLTLAWPYLGWHHRRHVVDVCAEDGFGEYIDGDLRIVPRGPVRLDDRGLMVEVYVDAFDAATGERLRLDDHYTFDRPPMRHDDRLDPAGALRFMLAHVIRRQRDGAAR